MGRSLVAVPLSEADRIVGLYQIRRIADCDVVFSQQYAAGSVVILLCHVLRAEDDDRLDDLLRRLEVVATFRGAFGV